MRRPAATGNACGEACLAPTTTKSFWCWHDAHLLQRGGGGGDGVGAFGDAALEGAGMHGEILREEARDGDAAGRVGAVGPVRTMPLTPTLSPQSPGQARGGRGSRQRSSKAARGERLLRQKRAAGGERKKPQIGRGAGERRIAVVVRARQEPVGGALEGSRRLAHVRAH